MLSLSTSSVVSQAHIQALKKTASKGDKKKKKEVGDEIARMTEEMEARHKRELDELRTSEPVAGVTEDLGTALSLGQDAAVAADGEAAAEEGTGNAAVRVSKAQKRRDAKARKEKERREEIERQEEENKFGARQVETDAIAARLKAK